MSLNDPISDLLTRIRNAAHAKHNMVVVPYSKLKEAFVRVLVREGFLSGVEVMGEKARKQIVISLKYLQNGDSMLLNIRRISKPGKRVYVPCGDIKLSRQGMGLSLFSTPKGILTDHEAIASGVGGEILCTVW